MPQTLDVMTKSLDKAARPRYCSTAFQKGSVTIGVCNWRFAYRDMHVKPIFRTFLDYRTSVATCAASTAPAPNGGDDEDDKSSRRRASSWISHLSLSTSHIFSTQMCHLKVAGASILFYQVGTLQFFLNTLGLSWLNCRLLDFADSRSVFLNVNFKDMCLAHWAMYRLWELIPETSSIPLPHVHEFVWFVGQILAAISYVQNPNADQQPCHAPVRQPAEIFMWEFHLDSKF